MAQTLAKQTKSEEVSEDICRAKKSVGRQVPPDPLLPVLDIERFDPDLFTHSLNEDQIEGSVRYGWIGTGQCGGRLVKAFYDLGYRKVLALNTTRRDLEFLRIPLRQKCQLDIGSEGAGKDISAGRRAVLSHQQNIMHLVEQTFGHDIDHIMVCFGAGGGTGSGSAAELVNLAKAYARRLGLKNPDRSVGVIMTLPTAGEACSPKVSFNAYTVASELAVMAWQGRISPLIIVDNARITRSYHNLTVSDYWPTINRTIAGLMDTFNRLSYQPSRYSSFDPGDYKSIITAGGCAIMGFTEVADIHDRYAVSRAFRQNLEETMLAGDFDMSRAKVAGSIVVGGKKMMSGVSGLQGHIDYGFDILAGITGDATIHRGIYEDDRETLRVYTIIGGLPGPTGRLEALR